MECQNEGEQEKERASQREKEKEIEKLQESQDFTKYVGFVGMNPAFCRQRVRYQVERNMITDINE